MNEKQPTVEEQVLQLLGLMNTHLVQYAQMQALLHSNEKFPRVEVTDGKTGLKRIGGRPDIIAAALSHQTQCVAAFTQAVRFAATPMVNDALARMRHAVEEEMNGCLKTFYESISTDLAGVDERLHQHITTALEAFKTAFLSEIERSTKLVVMPLGGPAS